MTQTDENRLRVRLDDYLHSWGLREFHDEPSYFSWQRTYLNREQLLTLEALVHRRPKDSSGAADIEFYDMSAQAAILPVLYSQRFDYFRKLGVLLCPRLSGATRVLDFGCGVGLLTTFFALEFPNIEFVGVDRSAQSIAMAGQQAKNRQIKNVTYHLRHIPHDQLPGRFDVILSTQAVFQSETDPGLPSSGWQTFQRLHSEEDQVNWEAQLGLTPRLDALKSVLHSNGRMILFEKTAHLGRRILFQRALSRRGFNPLQEPMPISYQAIDEDIVDGPLYEVSQSEKANSGLWSEEPFRFVGESRYGCGGGVARHMKLALLEDAPCDRTMGKSARWGDWQISVGTWSQALALLLFESRSGVTTLLSGGMVEFPYFSEIFEKFKRIPEGQGDQLITEVWGNLLDESAETEGPGYENHSSSAQAVYEALPFKVIQKEFTSEGEVGKAMHLEFGQSAVLWYFYWANTFDQRQLVLVCGSGEEMLRTYFEDSLRDVTSSSS